MTDERHVWPYWSVDLPGLTEDSAQRLLAWAADERLSLGGTAVDPAHMFSAHIDRESVEVLLAALEYALGSGGLAGEQASVARGFADQLGEWMLKP